MARKFFTGLLFAVQVIERLLPFIKRRIGSSGSLFADLRRKYRGAITAARFVYRRGVSTGKRQGRQQERACIAQRMLKMGFAHTVICKTTGLTRREVAQL